MPHLMLAWLYVKAYAVRLGRTYQLMWRLGTWSEIWILFGAVFVAVVAVISAVVAPSVDSIGETVGWLLFTWLLIDVVLSHVRDRLTWQQVSEDLLGRKAEGVPRVAVVSCSHGDKHRFLYGPKGWVEAGPAGRTPL